ncbi:TIGR03086 family metal-binding protein [Streptacidiphilus rugosus]|uniref:TIGR03086 family metal-binding protein n=1 Tax=Streptacidiphilus rugosus TaxID=405783 RepID=UPI00055BEEC2|nr:TIGR03086 family metal-binding protein [Streptacidiphilus rugosus]
MPINFTAADFDELRRIHARTVRDSVALVHRIDAADLSLPTPCDAWTLGELLAHMTAQHLGFAAAALGDPGDLTPWTVHPVDADFAARYEAAAELVIDAFAQVDVPERSMVLPELAPGRPFATVLALGFHLLDYAVHGWDVARALGEAYAPDAGTTAAVLPVALAIPDGSARLAPGSHFGPGLATAPDADTWARILATLGRSPSWRADTIRATAGDAAC